jgi:hypothetical protein
MYKPKFIMHFKKQITHMKDPRIERTKDHPLALLLFIAIGSHLCGGFGFNDMETFAIMRRDYLHRRFGMKRPPCHDTFERLFMVLDPARFNAFLACFSATLRRSPCAVPDIISFDGKTSRRTASPASGIPALHTLNAWSAENRLVLAQLAVPEKTNEVTAMPEMPRSLDLKGCIVTADALNTRKQTARQIVEQGADYLLWTRGALPAHPPIQPSPRRPLAAHAARAH